MRVINEVRESMLEAQVGGRRVLLMMDANMDMGTRARTRVMQLSAEARRQRDRLTALLAQFKLNTNQFGQATWKLIRHEPGRLSNAQHDVYYVLIQASANMRPIYSHGCGLLLSTGHAQVVMTLDVRIPDSRKPG